MSELKIVFVGHVDHGKSTIIGRLLYDTKSLPQGVVDKVQHIADETGKDFEFAYLLDAFAEEHQQGITIDTTQLKFSTTTRDYLIIDAPGHKEFLKNMISGAANANAAFLVIDAQTSQIDGTIFTDGKLTFRAELFNEFYYDVEQRKITQVAEIENVTYKIGDEIPTKGFSYEYPADFDLILLRKGGFVKIRGAKVISIGRLENYTFEKVNLVNDRGFGIKVNNAESFASFLKEFAAVENSRDLADFSNKYFFLNQFRELKFYFDYVI